MSVRLHDDVEAVEEKRARYEEELDRVNDLLTESESRRQTLQKEVDMLVEQVIKLSYVFVLLLKLVICLQNRAQICLRGGSQLSSVLVQPLFNLASVYEKLP